MRYAWEQLLSDRGFKIFDTLGEGAYSKVKAAYSSELGEEVAIKCISFRGAPKDFIEKFLPRELKILPLLCHNNIVQVHEVLEHYDGDQNNSYVCIVMESARHGDLLEYIQKKGALPETEIKKFFWQLCQAINYCHSQNICHRDLKCENLLLDSHNNVLLTDFGFAKPIQFNSNGDVVLSTTFCGSAAYAAPEILQGRPYDPRVNDMWSMGVILYIMSCGHMPFDDSNVKKMLKVQLRNRIRFPSRISAALSHNLKDLVRRLVEADACKRYTVEDALQHPFFDGYYDYSFGSGRTEPCCSKERIKYCESHHLHTQIASLRPYHETKEFFHPMKKRTFSLICCRDAPAKRHPWKLKRLQCKRPGR